MSQISVDKTELLELREALRRAIDTYQYASMTQYEREATAADRAFAEAIYDKYFNTEKETANESGNQKEVD